MYGPTQKLLVHIQLMICINLVSCLVNNSVRFSHIAIRLLGYRHILLHWILDKWRDIIFLHRMCDQTKTLQSINRICPFYFHVHDDHKLKKEKQKLSIRHLHMYASKTNVNCLYIHRTSTHEYGKFEKINGRHVHNYLMDCKRVHARRCKINWICAHEEKQTWRY